MVEKSDLIITLVEKHNGQKGNWQICNILRQKGKNNIILKPNGDK